MAKIGKKPTDDQLLEGGGGGGGSSGIKGTKWSSMPSFKGSSSTLDDLKKLTAKPTKAKGSAKRAFEMAQDRAVSRTVARGAGASALAAGAKAMMGKEAAATDSSKSDDYEDMGGDVNLDYSNPTGVAGRGMKGGGKVSSASSRSDGIAQRGKTKGRFV
jgi:hypothetical protein